MPEFTHKGQILPLKNQMIPIDKTTTFHASYDHGLHGFNQGEIVHPVGPERALHFDGASYIDFGNINNIELNDITFIFWIKTNSSNSQYIFSKSYASSGDHRYGVSTRGGCVRLFLNMGGADIILDGSARVDNGQWRHIAVVLKRNSNALIYVDGKLDAEGLIESGSSANMVSEHPFRIGSYTASDNKSPSSMFNGSISNLAVYNYASSSEEVQSHSHDRSKIMGYYKLSEKEGPLSFDSSKNQNDGVWHGDIISTLGSTRAHLQKNEGKFGGAVKLDSLEISGKNYVYSSQNLEGAWGYGRLGSAISYQKVDMRSEWGFSEGYRVKTIGGTHSIKGVWSSASKSSLEMSFEEEYTLSIYLKNLSSKDMRLQLNGLNSYAGPSTRIPPGYSGRLVFKGGIRRTDYSWFQINLVSYELEDDIDIVVGRIKLEDGGDVTDWTPAPEDDEADKYRDLRIEYPIDIINHDKGTLSFWAKLPYSLPYQSPSSGGLYMSTSGGYSSSGSLNFESSNSARPERVIGVHWGSKDDEGNHLSRTIAGVQRYNNGDWNMYTIAWDKNKGYKLYINGLFEGEGNSNLPLKPFDADVLHIKGMMLDELRIESRQISDEEAQAWAASGLHYNYLDYSTSVD